MFFVPFKVSPSYRRTMYLFVGPLNPLIVLQVTEIPLRSLITKVEISGFPGTEKIKE